MPEEETEEEEEEKEEQDEDECPSEDLSVCVGTACLLIAGAWPGTVLT